MEPHFDDAFAVISDEMRMRFFSLTFLLLILFIIAVDLNDRRVFEGSIERVQQQINTSN